MVTLTELEEQIMALPDGDRAWLASRLLQSLPPVSDDDDEGFQEAMRRKAEMQNNPERILSFEQLKKAVGR